MCFLRSDINNLKIYAPVERREQKMIKVNTIECDVESHQFKINIVNFTNVRLKLFRNSIMHKIKFTKVDMNMTPIYIYLSETQHFKCEYYNR